MDDEDGDPDEYDRARLTLSFLITYNIHRYVVEKICSHRFDTDVSSRECVGEHADL